MTRFTPRGRHLCLLLVVALGSFTAALPAQRMRIGSSNPTGFAGGPDFTESFFAAGDTKSGVELWSYDAGSGATLLVDVYPKQISSYPSWITRLPPTVGTSTWFVARTLDATQGELGRELHFYPKLPSSTAGSFVRDIRPGPRGSNPSLLTLVGKTLFFVADDGKYGQELWVSNGTAASTVLLKDIVLGATGSSPFGLTAFGSLLVFAATDVSGTELWVSNGTAAGTVMLRDIWPGRASSTPGGFAVWNGRVYFAASTEKEGREVWATDGTAAGTVLVADIEKGPGSSSPSQLTPGEKHIAFSCWTKPTRRQLWMIDTANAPAQIGLHPEGESITEITHNQGVFWFRARTKAAGSELWRATPAAITQVHDLWPGASGSFPANLTPYGKGVMFRAHNGVTGIEYWRTDGTTAVQVHDIRPGICSARPSRALPIVRGSRFLFAAKSDKTGVEVWSTTGTGAAMVADVDPLAPLPELHWDDSAPGVIRIDVKDAAPGRQGLLLVGLQTGPMVTFPFLRGAVNIDLRGPTVVVPFRTNNTGEFELRFQIPPAGQPTNLISQAIIITSAALAEASGPGSCNQGALDLNPPNGPRVEGRICLDDESGEYTMTAIRTDANPVPAYLGLYQKGPGGSDDLQLLHCIPIEALQVYMESGQIEIFLPLDPLEPLGRHLELHLFYDPPTPNSAGPASLVTTSYC